MATPCLQTPQQRRRCRTSRTSRLRGAACLGAFALLPAAVDIFSALRPRQEHSEPVTPSHGLGGAAFALPGAFGGDVYRIILVPLALITVALAWCTRPTVGNIGAALPAGFREFQFRYLSVWCLAIAADWLQGPYVYALYASYGYTPSEIAQLFVIGFGSAMICGTFIGAVADAWGRKRCALLYCVLYATACLTKHSSSYSCLILGRVLGGASTALLFSVFECWLVGEHKRLRFSEDLLGYMFGLMFFSQYVAAILAGFAAQAAATALPLQPLPGMTTVYYGGYTMPFDLSFLLLVVAAPTIYFQWAENYGEKCESLQQLFGNFGAAFRAMLSDKRVLTLGLAVSAFEGSMYAFVFNWTPALESGQVPPPHGLIFSGFMMACMCGSSLFSLASRGASPISILLPAVAAAGLALGAVTSCLGVDEGTVPTHFIFVGFLMFEASVGAYFPAVGTLKSEVVPEEARAGVYNLYRVPLNAIVIGLLLTDLPLRTSFGLCCFFLMAAALCLMPIFFSTKKKR